MGRIVNRKRQKRKGRSNGEEKGGKWFNLKFNQQKEGVATVEWYISRVEGGKDVLTRLTPYVRTKD